MSEWFFPRGSLARDGWEARVDDTQAGWRYTGLRIGAAGSYELPADGVERMVIPLDASSVVVGRDGRRVELAGRASVFAGPADVAYLGIGAATSITADGRFAVAEAPATRSLPDSVLRAGQVPVEVRGAGASSRQVHNFGTPGSLDAQNLIVCEVITPHGNWSSYPPHKHDTNLPGHESRLEEIYWFEVSGGDDGFGMFAAYSSPGHEIDLDERVRTGDVALIPHGYHGPAAAAPGYDLYYLNVMAGPDPDRVWEITDDPAHAWVRSTWVDQAADHRLPYPSEDS